LATPQFRAHYKESRPRLPYASTIHMAGGCPPTSIGPAEQRQAMGRFPRRSSSLRRQAPRRRRQAGRALHYPFGLNLARG